jgi:hypothetical protein
MYSSIHRRIWLLIMPPCFGFLTFYSLAFWIFMFRPEHHGRDNICRNAHLVHQNWYRRSFTFEDGDTNVEDQWNLTKEA